MSELSAVDPEEAQAIQELVAADVATHAAVRARNFREPRRLSDERMRSVGATLRQRLPQIVQAISVPLREGHELSVLGTSELNGVEIFDGLPSKLFALEFDSTGGRGWLFWEGPAALATAEKILSGESSEEPEERGLSSSEARILEGFLGSIVRPLAESLELSFAKPRIVQSLEDLNALDGGDPRDDTQRLRIHLSFEGPGGASEMRIYLPGLSGDAPRGKDSEEMVLPDHLDTVQLDLRAFLGRVDVPLRDLLKLEVGDVIPLGVPVGKPLELYVEDRACAKARWGRSQGRLAVHILEFDLHPGEIDPPAEPE